MQRLLRPLALASLAMACGSALAATAEPAPLGKLPRWAVPESYALALRVDPRQSDFSGTAVIDFDLKKDSDHVWIHGQDLKVGTVSIRTADGRQLPARYVSVAPQEGVVRIDFGRSLAPQKLQLSISYVAPLNRQLQGLYKVSHAGKPYAMTQMEPVSARYAFPGFDEPDFKTPYHLSLTIPADEAGVANTRQIGEKPAGAGWKTLSFAPTRPLPSYLVAFAVGPWDIQPGPVIQPDAQRSEPVELRGIAAQGEGHRLQHVLSETPAIIRTLEDYYGFGYPFGKLDLLAAPDFSAGAMENPGLVTFRDWLLLLDPDSAARYVQLSFNVTAHELAHQWTGDTVTLAWWDDLWLNESFATWMQQKVTQQLHPEYRADLDRVRGAEQAMNGDSLVTTRKIRQPITGNGDIETAFDGITYQKGAAVLGMFEAYVGADKFRQGMRHYIQAHAFGNATADDLIDSVADAAGQGERFKQAFRSFLDQPGVPYVQTRTVRQDGRTWLELSQSRYLPWGSKGRADAVWGVPVCVRYQIAGGSKRACELLDQVQGRIELPGAVEGGWVLPNAQARGYYRFGMDGADLKVLSRHLSELDDAEQLAYADAVAAAFRHGDLDASDVLQALQPLTGSKVREVATAPLGVLGWIRSHEAQTPAQKATLQTWVSKAYLPRLQALGYQRKPGESAADALLRSELARLLALDFPQAEVRSALLQQGDAVLNLKDGHLDFSVANPDLAGLALAVATQIHGKATVDRLIEQLPLTSDPARRNAILAALAAVEQPSQAARIRDLALDPRVKVGEMAALLSGNRDTEAGRDAIWHWSVAHYQAIVDRTGSFSGGRLPALMGGGGCSAAESERLQAFFKSRVDQVTGAARGLAQTVEATELCSALKAKQDPASITP